MGSRSRSSRSPSPSAGSRPVAGSSHRVPRHLPADLDSYLAANEAAVEGVIPGAEKHIVWARAPGVQTPLSLVYIHGWQGSPLEYQPVFSQVASAVGANLYYARLKGYGVITAEIRRVSVEDWINDVAEAYEIGRRIGDRVVVVGCSMGGDLTLWLACQNPPECAAVVLLSCAVQPKDRRSEILLWPRPIPQVVLRVVSGPYNRVAMNSTLYPTGNANLYARLNPARYPSVSTIRLMSVVRLTRSLPIETIRAPSLWLYSNADDVVDIPTLKRFYERAGGSAKRLVHVDGAPAHMLAGDMFSPGSTREVVGHVLSFLRETGVFRSP